MKLILVLVVCSMIASSLATPSFSEEKLAKFLKDIEQDLMNSDEPDEVPDQPQPVLAGDIKIKKDEQPSPLPSGDIRFKQNTESFTPAKEEMLLHADNIKAATAEIEAAGGQVKIQLGHDLLIADVPAEFIAKKNSFTHASAHISQDSSSSNYLYAQAYWKYQADKLESKPTVQRWTEKTAPKAFAPDPPGNQYNIETMTGNIAVFLLVASGPTDSLCISYGELCNIISEAITGLQFWVREAPASASLSFKVFYGFAVISAQDSVTCSSYAACHNVFADATLQYFGYPTGQTGRDQLVGDYKGNSGGAYISYFSKYKQSHFAYAYFHGGPIYMQYSNDGWGPSQIDRLFAHETGHVFNAPDEYTNCQCSRQYGEGTCTDVNGNCKDCTGSQVNCIMDYNDFEMCDHTRKHVGWC